MPSNTLHKIVWEIPAKAKGNCYVFALGPKVGPTGYSKSRTSKSVPGDKCLKENECCYRNKNFNFNDCNELKKRIICDNPGTTRVLRSNVSNNATDRRGFHMM